MKKALALVLTLSMLISCVAMAVSAAREFAVEENTPVDFAWTASGEFWDHGEVSKTDYFKTEVRVMGDSEKVTSSNVQLQLDGRLARGPYINLTKDQVGIGDAHATAKHFTLNYDFDYDKWYDITYVTKSGVTTVSVNGTEIGTVEAEYVPSVGHLIYDVYVGDYKITDLNTNEVVFHETFDKVPEKADGGSIIKFEGETVVNVLYNDNVSKGKDFAWTASGDFWDHGEVSKTDYFKTEVRIMGDSAKVTSPNVQLQFDGRLARGPYINLTKDQVGIGDAHATAKHFTLDYDFDYDKWYDITYVTKSGVTTVSVNGTEIGTVEAEYVPSVGHLIYDVYMADYKITDLNTNNVIFHEEFNSVPAAATSGSIVAFDVEYARYDLGEWYWCNPDGFNYNPVNVGNQGENFDVEMDICLDTDSSGLTTGWPALATAPVITTAGVGVGNVSVAYKFEVGTWYHIKWDAEDGKTTIYVDDAYVGTVDGTATLHEGNQAFWCWDKISVDNVRIGSYFADMEDGDLTNSVQGTRLKYDFGVVAKDPLKNVPKYNAGGEALLLENTSSSAYLYAQKSGTSFENSIVSFDVALIPNVESTKNQDGVWFQFWRKDYRFQIGTTGAGRGEDTTNYADAKEGMAWGNADVKTFHDVVIWFEYGKGTIYVDGVEMYSGMCSAAFDEAIIMMPINCSAIIDNFNIYDLNMNVIMDTDSLIACWSDDSAADPVKVNVDAEKYCATNGHIFYEIKRTTTETCTSTGVDTTYCAVCGEGYNETTIAMVAHQYNNFDKNRVVDGYYYSDCRNCGGERVYSKIPAEGSYTGTINAYFDMEDTFFAELKNEYATPVNSDWMGDQFRYENGKAVLDADTYLASYTTFNFRDLITGGVDFDNWSYSYRMTYNGLFDTDDITNSGYPHTFYFWLRGATLEIGYNADTQEIYIGSSGVNGGVPIERIAAHYEFKEGLTYTFKFGLRFIEEDVDLELTEYADIAIWINDELVLIHSMDETGANIYFDCEFITDEHRSFINPRNFGFSYTMDDLVIGSYDFAWNKVAGDVDNDGVLSVADAMVMRKYLAKVIDDEAVFVDLMDVNADEAINAKDQLAIRKALAA